MVFGEVSLNYDNIKIVSCLQDYCPAAVVLSSSVLNFEFFQVSESIRKCFHLRLPTLTHFCGLRLTFAHLWSWMTKPSQCIAVSCDPAPPSLGLKNQASSLGLCLSLACKPNLITGLRNRGHLWLWPFTRTSPKKNFIMQIYSTRPKVARKWFSLRDRKSFFRFVYYKLMISLAMCCVVFVNNQLTFKWPALHFHTCVIKGRDKKISSGPFVGVSHDLALITALRLSRRGQILLFEKSRNVNHL